MTSSDKQRAWDLLKVARRAEVRSRDRGVAITIPSVRRITARTCPCCPHAWKHHKHTGRCRRNCPCTMGSERARF